MTIRDRKGLKQTAASRLSEAGFDPRLLILIHTGVSIGATLLVTVINYILQQQINSTGGLSGIGLRSILATAQSALQLACIVLLPFWEFGMVYAAMGIARKRSAEPADLTAGFRRFGPVLRLSLLRSAIIFAVIMLCVNIGTGIFMATPLSAPLYDILLPILEASSNNAAPTIDEATLDAIFGALLPLIPILLGLVLLLVVPVLYRLRMADYLIMEDKKTGALEAMATSWRMTQGRAFALFRLDLSFWWFYALQAVAVILSYGDAIAGLLGITLPISPDLAALVCYLLYGAAILVLYWRFGSYVQTTYAVAYDTLRYQCAMPTPKPTTSADHEAW